MSKRGSGEGSVFKMSDGRWRASVSLGYKNGKRQRRVFTGRTRRDVAERLARAVRDQGMGLPLPGVQLRLGEYLTDWLAKSAKPRVRASTLESYSWIVNKHLVPGLGKVPLAKLTAKQIDEFLSEKRAEGLSARTCQHIHAILRTALRQAEKWSLVQRNVATLVDAPSPDHREVPSLGPDQIPAFLQAVQGDRLESLFVLTVASGLRQGEALGLSWDAIDFEKGTVAVRRGLQRVGGKLTFVEPKTNRSRRVLHVPQFAVASLRAHQMRQEEERMLAGSRWRENSLVFCTTIGTPLDGPNVTHRLQRLLNAAELPRMRFHDLRHACASLLLFKGIHPRVVMDTLGHSQISLTMNTYSHVVPALQREAADKMDEVFEPVATHVATFGTKTPIQ